MEVALVTIAEPQRLQSAVGALWAAYLAAMATLKMQFAFVVSIALGMADSVKLPVVQRLAPALAPFFGAKYKHWAGPPPPAALWPQPAPLPTAPQTSPYLPSHPTLLHSSPNLPTPPHTSPHPPTPQSHPSRR